MAFCSRRHIICSFFLPLGVTLILRYQIMTVLSSFNSEVILKMPTASETPGKTHSKQELRSDSAIPDLGDCLNNGLCPWQPVTGAKHKFYVISAYTDLRQGKYIRVIGVTGKRPEKVKCMLGFKNEPGLMWTSVPARIDICRDDHGKNLTAVFVLCPVKDEIPSFVSLSPKGSNTLSPEFDIISVKPTDLENGNILPVLNRSPPQVKPDKFRACVKPTYYGWDYPFQFIEFIEFQRILGVSHFTLYNASIGPQVDCLIKRYVKEGLVTIVPWNVNIPSENELQRKGIFASINDCLYRNMDKADHIVFVDFDEFIIPRKNWTYSELIDSMALEFEPNITGGYIFRNGFFFQSLPRDTSIHLDVELLTQVLIRRIEKFSPHMVRTKYIARPRSIVEAGNHFPWKYIKGMGPAFVPTDIAYSHHYRVCGQGFDCTQSTIEDRTAQKYQKRLYENVLEALRKYGLACNIR